MELRLASPGEVIVPQETVAAAYRLLAETAWSLPENSREQETVCVCAKTLEKVMEWLGMEGFTDETTDR